MPLTIQAEGAPRLITALTIYSGDTPRVIRNLWIYAGGVKRLIFTSASSLTASASPSPTEGRCPSYSDTAVTPAVTITPVGGQAPYSYSWVVTSFQGISAPNIPSPSSATTPFYQSGLSEFDANDCVFTGTVTDALGASVAVSVSVTFFGPIDRGDLR